MRLVDIKKLESFIKNENIADSLSREKLCHIGSLVVSEYEVDEASREEITTMNKKAMDLAMQVSKKKSFPWNGAANVKLPMITVAGIQFASRALPALIPDEKIVGIKIIGDDPDGSKIASGERVARFMDYQLTELMDNWLIDTDRMLHQLPITGTCFRKIYFDPLSNTPKSTFLGFDDVIVNVKASCIKTARRITHKFKMFKNTIIEHQKAEIWRDVDIGEGYPDEDDNTDGFGDDDTPHILLEQHRWLDLDGDGYQEPYIVTVHKNSKEVLRIIARYNANSIVFRNGKAIKIEPTQFFVKYPFLPSPDGSFYDMGFGTLLLPINSSANTAVNQLLDAGTLANAGGGFMGRGLRIKKGGLSFKPGEWKTIDVMGAEIKNNIVPLPIREPSQVLFQLLGLLITSGKDISSVQDAIAGNKPGENVSAATVTALIEQGLKVFSGIHKRVYRAMTEEFKLIYKLNAEHLKEPQYLDIIDGSIDMKDFDINNHNISPSAEPQFSLDVQKVGKAESLMRLSGRQGLDEDKITYHYLKAIEAPEDILLKPSDRPENPPNTDLEKIKLERDKFNLKLSLAELEKNKLQEEINKIRADALLQLARAESEEEGQQLEEYKVFSENLKERKQNEANRASKMESRSANKASDSGVGVSEGKDSA
jgi:chaperonin GroES